MYQQHIDAMYDCIKEHFPGFSDTSVKLALTDYWKDKLVVVWTVGDVFSAFNESGKIVSYAAALEILDEAKHHHDASIGISWRTILELGSDKPFKEIKPGMNPSFTCYIDERGRVCQW